MASTNPDHITKISLHESPKHITDKFEGAFNVPFEPLNINKQLVSMHGDILNINNTLVKPLSKTWVDKKSGEIRPANFEEIENQYDEIIRGKPDHLSMVVTSVNSRNGLLNVVAYCSRAVEHELLVGSLLENRIVTTEQAKRILDYESGGILVPSIYGKQHLTITGVMNGNRPLSGMPYDSLFHLSTWGAFPENPRAKSKLLRTIEGIGEGVERSIVTAYNTICLDKVTNPFKALTTYDTVTKEYL